MSIEQLHTLDLIGACHKLRCAVRQDSLHIGAGLHQFARQIQRLIASDTAGYAQYNVFSRQSVVQPPLWVTAGVTVNFGVAVALGMATLFALPTLVLFDLPAPRAWLYGLALAFRWPLVSLGLLALAFLLGLGARALGLAGWVLWPMALLPFNVTAVLLLMRRGYERERTQKELSTP